MTTLKAACDICGEIIEGQVYEDYDHVQMCHKCHLESELREKESQYKSKMDWLKRTYIKELKAIRKRILKLKEEIEPYNK